MLSCAIWNRRGLAVRNEKAEARVYRHEFPPSARRYAVTQQTVERAEAAVLETLVFGGLIATAVAAAIYDIGLWIGAW
jgi:hypothetical protein